MATARNNTVGIKSVLIPIVGSVIAVLIIVVISYFSSQGDGAKSQDNPLFDSVRIEEGRVYYDTTGLITVLSFQGQGLTYDYADNTVAAFVKKYGLEKKVAVNVTYQGDPQVFVDCESDERECLVTFPATSPKTMSVVLLQSLLQVQHPTYSSEKRIGIAIAVVDAQQGATYAQYVSEIEEECMGEGFCEQVAKSEYQELVQLMKGKRLPLKSYYNGKLINPREEEFKE